MLFSLSFNISLFILHVNLENINMKLFISLFISNL